MSINYQQVNPLGPVYRWTDGESAGTVWNMGDDDWHAYADAAMETVATAATREDAVRRAVELSTESLTDVLHLLVDEASSLNWMGDDSKQQAAEAKQVLPDVLERVLRAADRVLEAKESEKEGAK